MYKEHSNLGPSVVMASQEIDGEHYRKVLVSNFAATFRDGFDDFIPDAKWAVSPASGDLLKVDGNAAGAGYLVISKDPLSAGATTTITSKLAVSMPVEVGFGAHLSQRTLGQEFSVEFVSNDTAIATYTDAAISAITQTASVLTVTTAAAHGLAIGNAIGIYGVGDSRFNYPALVVATVPAPNQFTVTAGPGGAIPSVTATPTASGYVTKRPRLGNAQSGSSMIFENATATNASFYARSSSGDAIMSGTIAASHAATINTTASVQAINSPYTYAFRPTSEYRLAAMSDRLQWYDSTVDSIAQATVRQTWTQVAPDPSKSYNLRIRATNNKGLTVPVAKIVSMAKTGTTTATVVTDVAHGLTIADLVNIYGSSDQTAYANLTAATAVASVVNATTFTVVIGTAVTSTVYGGYVARVQGNNLMSSLGAIAQVAVSATLATAADGKQVLTLTGNAAWSGLLIGDYVNVHGLRSVPGVGSDLGVDGAWKVRNIVTTALELEFLGSTALPANFGATVCGGAVIKRTDLRLSFVRMFDYDRTRVEMLARPAGDKNAAAPIMIQGGVIDTLPTLATVTTVGTVTTIGSVTSVTTAGTPPVPATPYFLNSAATTNSNLVLTGTSGLQAFFATNTGAGVAFVKLYNKATAPTVGTDVPEMIIPVPAAVAGVPGQAALPIGYSGFRFALGLGIGITGAVGDTDTTAVAAGQVKVKLTRTV